MLFRSRFVEGFIRPFGVDQAGTTRFAEAIEQLVATPAPAPTGTTVTALAARAALYPPVGALQLLLATQPYRKSLFLTLRKWRQDGRRWFWVSIKHAAQRQLGEKDAPLDPTVPVSEPARTSGRSAKVPGWDLPDAEDARQFITALGRGGKPIIVGPWLSEAGFELLYWIPFLAWAKVHGNLDPSQLVVVSRGGAGAWYRDISHQYEDVFSFYSPDEFRTKNDARIAQQGGRLKHVEVTDFDREIIRAVTEKRGLSGARLLHP